MSLTVSYLGVRELTTPPPASARAQSVIGLGARDPLSGIFTLETVRREEARGEIPGASDWGV